MARAGLGRSLGGDHAEAHVPLVLVRAMGDAREEEARGWGRHGGSSGDGKGGAGGGTGGRGWWGLVRALECACRLLPAQARFREGTEVGRGARACMGVACPPSRRRRAWRWAEERE